MSETGDDCYFYYYSTCAKGDTCPFRHQPAALGCEITCHLWEKGRCFKKACNFRHMVIEKERNTIPCFWESQPMGCTKNNCPFLHLKPRQIEPVLPQPRPAMTSTRMPVYQPSNQSIPTLHGNVGPANPQVGPMHPEGPRASVSTRPPMYNRPGMPFNQGPYMDGPRPMRYEGFMPRGQPPLMMYQMQNSQQHIAGMQYPGMVQAGMVSNMLINQPRGNFPYENIRRRDDHGDESDPDYTSSDYSDVSISDGENDRRSRPKDHSPRHVRSPRHQSSRREVRRRNNIRDKRDEPSRSSREKDKKYEQRRKDRSHQTDREKGKTRSKDIDYSPGKSRKTSEGKDSTNYERKKEDKSPEKEILEKESSDGDIKVKTLEEILREKALKNLHERTAQKKKAQMEAEKNTRESNGDEANDDSPEPIIKSVVSVNKTESTTSSKCSEPQETNDTCFNSKSKTAPEKKVQLRTAKTIIRSIIESDNQTSALSTETVAKKVVRKIVVESDEKPNITPKEANQEAVNILSASAPKQTTSRISTIKVKTLEEIKKEKQDRKAKVIQELETKDKDYINADNTSIIANEQVVADDGKSMSVNVKPMKGRKISIKKRDHEGIAAKPNVKSGGKLLVKRKVDRTETNTVMEKEKDVCLKDGNQSKSEKTESETEKSKDIIIKSFEEIMKEKRERQKKQNQEQQEKPKEATSVMRIKRPAIVRRKETETQQEAPKKFASRKLKIVRQQGYHSKNSISTNIKPASIDSSSTPASPNQSESGYLSPVSALENEAASISDVELVSSKPSLTEQPLSAESNVGLGNQSSLSDLESRAFKQNESQCVEEDDDDESWQHEELPEVPMDTPTLEGPTFIAGTTDTASETTKAAAAAVIHIPGKTNLFDHQISPTKRPRSSLEELFGVPCDDDDEQRSEQNLQIEDKEKVSPAKRVKTYQETHEAIVKAVNQELSAKEDDFDLDLDLEEEIANLSPGKPHDDSHEGYNEDDLLLELDEMINE